MARMLFLPLFAILVYIMVSVTFAKKTAKPAENKPAADTDSLDPSKRQGEIVLDCAPKAIGDSTDTEVVCTESKEKVRE